MDLRTRIVALSFGKSIAEILGISSITVTRKVEESNGKVGVKRVVSDGHEVVETSIPVLATASSELGDLRFPI